MASPVLLYVLAKLWIHGGRETEFEAYERKVARIMARYGGVIECAIRPSRASEPDAPYEIHVLKFPSQALYNAYRNDPERLSLSGERDSVITRTDVLVGTAGPAYGS